MGLTRDEIISRMAESNGNRDLSGLDLSGADLSRLDLRGYNLSRADLSAADLRWAVLEGADLHSTVLRRADARWAIMRGANLRQADLGRANLGWADISGADLTGADIDGTNFENVNLNDVMIERRGRSRDWGMGAAKGPARNKVATDGRTGELGQALTSGLALPEVTPVTVAAVGVALVALVYLWGWLFHRSYFLDGFKLDPATGVVRFSNFFPNLGGGLLTVGGLMLKTLIATPLFLLALVLVAAAVLAIPAAFWFFGERILGDIVRPRLRPFVVGGLFVAYAVLFFFFLPYLVAGGIWLYHNALPGDAGLRSVFRLVQVGGILVQLGFLAVLIGLCVPLWVGWRWFSHWFVLWQTPTEWRLRYPALNSALNTARGSRLFARSEPLTLEERQRGALGLVAVVLVLGTLLTGTGKVFALEDMCDGGRLARVQLYIGRQPADEPPGNLLCQRELAKTDKAYFVFFPSQSTEEIPGDWRTRRANVISVPVEKVVYRAAAAGGTDDDECATCLEGPTGKEQGSVDPDQVQVAGVVKERPGNMLLLDVKPNDIGSIRTTDTTRVTKNGRPAVVSDIQPGDTVRAFGIVDVDGITLNASEINVVPVLGPTPTPPIPATLVADTTNPQAIVLTGTGWAPGEEIQIGLAPPGETGPTGTRNPLTTVIADPAGTFSSPIQYVPGMPTGLGYMVVASGPSGQFAGAPWLAAPPAPPTATATQPPPTVETTPSTDQLTPTQEVPTATSETAPTNTPFPNSSVIGPPPGCDRDEFEFDSGRGFQKEIYPTFGGDAAKQKHNFCPKGDIDLAFFRVKKGRWYKVATSNLAPGVDTVLAVGDLSNDTVCSPAGCWSDDRAALTYDSEVVLQAVEDGTAIITVDNRGSKSGTDATYDLSVQEFVPDPTATPTFGPTDTATPTDTPTVTPLPPIDRFEQTRGYRNDYCRYAYQYLEVGRDYVATLDKGTDEDYYEVVPLNPGEYTVTLRVPKKQDYDFDILEARNPSRDDCPIYTPLRHEYRGEGETEEITFPLVSGQLKIVIKVFTPYTNVYGDSTQTYRLRLDRTGEVQTPTPTPTLTPVGPPTPRPYTPVPAPSPSITPITDLLPGTSTPPPSPLLHASPFRHGSPFLNASPSRH